MAESDIRPPDGPVSERVRAVVAAHARGPEDEQLLLSALGLEGPADQAL
ncbi:hypothetical protein ACIGZJ_34380 [Kitasatospora sp. NPDC052868]